jgi:hypothetical protein
MVGQLMLTLRFSTRSNDDRYDDPIGCDGGCCLSPTTAGESRDCELKLRQHQHVSMSIARLTVCITSEPLKVVVITVVWAVSAAVVPASVVCPSTVVCCPKLVVNNEVSVIGSPDGPFEVVVSVFPVSVVCCPSVVVNNEVSVGGSPDGWFDVVEVVSAPSVPSAVAVPVV